MAKSKSLISKGSRRPTAVSAPLLSLPRKRVLVAFHQPKRWQQVDVVRVVGNEASHEALFRPADGESVVHELQAILNELVGSPNGTSKYWTTTTAASSSRTTPRAGSAPLLVLPARKGLSSPHQLLLFGCCYSGPGHWTLGCSYSRQ